jgi:phenylacetate-coenzyme A ligase PaaK-like adenylate-forming protein
MFPKPDSCALIGDLFGCPVTQEWGGVEFGNVALKLGAQPFEVFSDLQILEIAGANLEGAGEAIVTCLYPRYTPMVRYRPGDALRGGVRLEHGHVERFEALDGRVQDTFAMPDGQCVHAVAVMHCIHQEPSVYNIQLALTDLGPRIRLVVGAGPRDDLERRIRRRLAQVHPSLERVPVEYVADLSTNRAGKRRWVIDQRTP